MDTRDKLGHDAETASHCDLIVYREIDMSWTSTNNDELASILELRSLSDRAAAIVAASLVEIRLEEAIKRSIVKNEDLAGELFNEGGPLGAFATKAKLSHLIGIIGTEAYGDLKNFIKIRNAFAHRITVRDFNSDSINNRCQNLKLIEKHFRENKDMPEDRPPPHLLMGVANGELRQLLKSGRERYMMTAQLFTLAFSFHSRLT